MENYITIEQLLDNMDKNIVYKTKTSKWIGLSFLILGTVFFSTLSVNDWSSVSIIPPLLLVLGMSSSVFGLLKLFFRNDYFVAASNHQKLKSFDIYFDAGESNKLVQFCSNGKITEIHLLNRRSFNGGLKLRVLSTKDLGLCFSQVIGYEQSQNITLSIPIQHTRAEADYLKKMKV